jgi:hypothetical protein
MPQLASWLSIPDLKKCPHIQICYRLAYDASQNSLQLGYPVAVPVAPIRLAKDVPHRLF